MKKTKKALASLAIAGMVLSMAPASVFAATTNDRLAGADRYETSIAIAEKAYASADTAVIAAGNPSNLVDALAAAPLAAQEDAPIYLTDKADMDNGVIDSLKKLGVKDVIVVGAAASQAVVDELKAAGFTVDAVKGAGRVETAQAINAKLSAPAGTIVVGYNGVADAMSVASYAAANNYAIVVANQNGTVAAGTDADFIIGGPTLVKDIADAKRIFGADRYETNKNVIAELDFEYSKVYVGNGATLADALVGSVLAAQDNAPIVLTDGKTVKADVASNLADDSVVVALGGTGVVSNAVVDAVKNPPSTTPTGEFKVESVAATAADTFTVKFSKAAADTSKVTFEVKQDTAPVTVSASWNEAKTEATLQKSAKFVEATYTVSVKDGEKDLGSKTVSVTEQRIAKIDITSDKLGIVTEADGDQFGYATYKIYDQYDVDITNSALANNVDFKTGVGDAVPDKGLLTITADPNLNLLTFTSGIVISAHDTTTGVSTTKNLIATSQVGTLSDFSFKAGEKLEIVADEIDKVYYLDFTAKDISGNETKNYTLLKEGLIFSDEDELELTVSHTQVTAKLIQDPADSKKGLIEVTVQDIVDNQITVDQPGVITAMTWTGKTSQVDYTLKKPAQVDKFKLYAPSEVISSMESKEIPFAAYDQNGKAITKYTDLVEKVTLSGAKFYKNPDGTAYVKNDPIEVGGNLTSVTRVITSVVKNTGDYSSVTLRIQEAVEADNLKIDSSVVKTILEADGAVQTADFGWDEGGFSVQDQYGRDIDMTSLTDKVGKNYKVVVTTSSAIDAVVVGGSDTKIGDKTYSANQVLGSGESYVKFTSNKGVGTGTIKFTLYHVNGTEIDSKSITFTSLDSDDIKDYRIEQLEKPLYAKLDANATTAGAFTAQLLDYNATPDVYGLTASKADVVLKDPNVIIGAKSTSTDFVVYGVYDEVAQEYTGGAYDSIKVVAKKSTDLTKTESKGFLTVTIKGADNKLYTVSTPLTSSTASPAAASLKVVVATEKPGIEVDDVDSKKITLTGSSADIKAILGTTFNKYNTDGSAGLENVYFAPKDQYGETAAGMAYFSVLENNTTVAVDAKGNITGLDDIKAGEGYKAGDDLSMTVSASTTTGLIETIEIVFNVTK
ncbi:MAG: cell wall-binding repeat-containing protein [Desulfitobacterium sp.]